MTPLNDDLIGIVMSYLDITEFKVNDRPILISALGSTNSDKIISNWMRESKTEVVSYPNYYMSYVNGKRHSETQYAVRRIDGVKEWRFNDQLHRLDGPAFEDVIVNEWHVYGQLHRLDGPAVEWNDGRKEWYVNGQRHRVDGPAIQAVNRSEWWINGKRHREDGPAIEWSDSLQEWWIDGNRIRIEWGTPNNQ